MKRRILWQAAFLSVAGLLLGSVIAGTIRSAGVVWPWTPVFVLLGALAAWLKIPLAPYGSLDFSPLVFLVVTVASRASDGLIIAIIAPVLATFASQRRYSDGTLLEAMVRGGEAALGLAASVVLARSFWTPRYIWLDTFLLAVLCLLSIFLFRTLYVSMLEGVKLRRLLGPMARSSLPHFVSITLGAMLISAVFVLVGEVGILLASVVIIEMYYPRKLLGEQRDLFMKSLQMVSNAVDVKDPYTAHHSRRVSEYATRMARVLDIPEVEVGRIRIGALMHDIGKIGVPGTIIRKPSKLTDEEMEIMRRHVEDGARIVEGLEILREATTIVRHHHENYDGTGYPAGISGDEIPIGSRIIFVADAFDALTTDRPYRSGRPASEALRILDANTPKQFDPKAVAALKKVLSITPEQTLSN